LGSPVKKVCKIPAPAVTILTVMIEPTPLPSSESPASRPVRIDWAAALAEHNRWLRTAILARLGERQAVDEVLQEVALDAIVQRAPLGDAAKVGPWLYRLAIRKTLLYRRRRGRQRLLVGRYATRDQLDAAPVADPLDWLLLDERRRLVREALTRLPARDAEILLLKYTEEFSYRDLAARLGISEAAVEARLHRARGRLRDALAATRVIEIEVSE
jgi:RNA polymerase sigma factor (sigma-70 family)